MRPYNPMVTRELPSLPIYLRWVRDLRDESNLEMILSAVEDMRRRSNE